MSKAFPPLFETVLTPVTLGAAWDKVRGNGGCAGGDGEIIEQFHAHALQRLRGLAMAMGDGTYRPRDLRLMQIPKKGWQHAAFGDPLGAGPDCPDGSGVGLDADH